MFEIRTLAPGEKISEPGFYSIPLDVHHNQPCDSVSVTSGILRNMELKSPADVWATHILNPDRIPGRDTDALRLGRIMAALIERGEDGARDHVLVLPGAKEQLTTLEMIAMVEAGEEPSGGRPQKPNFEQVKRYIEGNPTPAGAKSVEFWKAVEEDPREVVTQEEWETLCAMGRALAADPAASAALGGHPEITMAWKDEANDLWCLARPDQTAFSGLSSDYKKVSTQGRPFNHRMVDARITQYGYVQQMAFAAEGFQAITGNHLDQIGLVFQCDTPPYHVILREVDEEAIQYGLFLNRRARRRFRECLDAKHWPGPGEDIGVYQMPEWLREKLNDEMTTEGLVA